MNYLENKDTLTYVAKFLSPSDIAMIGSACKVLEKESSVNLLVLK